MNVLLALTVYLVMVIFGKQIIRIFNSNPEMIRLAYDSMLVYGISFPFAAINIVYTTYFLSVKQTAQAMCAVLRSFILNVVCIFAVPALLGDAFIWLGIAVAEACDTGFVIAKVKRNRRK